MAALYLHNALFSPEGPESPSPHSRHLSAVSTATLRSTSEYSHPTEPLLHSDTSESLAYLDLLARQPLHPDGPRTGWDLGLNFDGDGATRREIKRNMDKLIRQRLRKLRIVKGSMELVMGIWGIYNATRYFVAYTVFPNSSGQITSLVLATSVSLSLGLLMASALISLFRPYLLLHGISLRVLLVTRATLQYLASLFLTSPAITNLVLLIVWKNTSTPPLSFRDRCHLDIDVFWSISASQCKPSATRPWGAWLTLSIARVAFTILFIVIYHVVARIYQQTRRSSKGRTSRFGRSPHISHLSQTSLSSSLASPPLQTAGGTTTMRYVRSLSRSGQSSRSTLGESMRRNSVGDHSSGGTSRSSSLRRTFPVGGGRVRGDSSDQSFEESSGAEHYSQGQRPDGAQTSDIDIHGFVDRFKSLVGQITRETDQALEYSGIDGSTTYTSNSSSAPMNAYASSSRHISSSSQYGYEEEPVRMLGGFVRRMPTIESLGSKEMGSIYAASSSQHDGVLASTKSIKSSHSQSHPPTRANTLMSESSDALSRSNSLSLNAAAGWVGGAGGLTMNEAGEIVGEHQSVQSGSASNGHGSVGHGSLSRSTISYHTATSSPLQSPVEVEEERIIP